MNLDHIGIAVEFEKFCREDIFTDTEALDSGIKGNEANFECGRIFLETEVAIFGIDEEWIGDDTVILDAVFSVLFEHCCGAVKEVDVVFNDVSTGNGNVLIDPVPPIPPADVSSITLPFTSTAK